MNPDNKTTIFGILSGLAVFLANGLTTGNWADPVVIANALALMGIGKLSAGQSEE